MKLTFPCEDLFFFGGDFLKKGAKDFFVNVSHFLAPQYTQFGAIRKGSNAINLAFLLKKISFSDQDISKTGNRIKFKFASYVCIGTQTLTKEFRIYPIQDSMKNFQVLGGGLFQKWLLR